MAKRRADLWKYIGLAVLAVVTFGVVAATFLTPEPVPPASTVTPKAAPSAKRSLTAPAPLKLDPGTKSVFFGDSWTAGYASEPSTRGFAYRAGDALRLDYEVDATGSGTGYLNPGPEKNGTYATRLAKRPVDPSVGLLVLQGGLNDQGQALSKFVNEARRTIALAKAKFPKAQIVIMGPINPTPTAGTDLMTIDASLMGLAEANAMHYISGHQARWITPENLADVIDESKASHPSTAGHAYLADKVADALRRLAA